ncbi:hypothetical protein ACET3X_002126 [Alternaria dauci]|uniref:Uncharacterized protein n=1 Tax=Alternaria dauci TaxID=48095 RepID=A0ABR3UQK0_9PLEO
MAPHLTTQRRYAFSHALVGIKPPEKADHQLLRTLNWGSSASQTFRDTKNVTKTSSEEMVTNIDNKDNIALWVGLKPAQARALRAHDLKDIGSNPEDQEAYKALRKIKIPRSSSVNSVSKFPKLPIWTREGGMTRVVFNCMQGKLQLYELVNRDSNTMLCKPFPVPAEDVFFVHECRSDSMTGVQDRIRGWNQNIKAYLGETLNDSLDNRESRPAKDTSSVEVPAELGNIFNIQGIINQYGSTGKQWLLDQIERAVQDANKHSRGTETAQHIAIHRLMELDATFDQASATSAQVWLEDMFPDFAQNGHLTPHTVFEYGTYLRKTQTRITYGKLKASLGLFMVYQQYHSEDGTIESCKEAIARVSLLFHQDTESPPPKFRSVSTELGMWLEDHVRMMQAILDAHQASLPDLVDFHGATMSGEDLHQMWENVAQSSDRESAKEFLLQTSRYMVKELLAKYTVTEGMMENYMSMLQKTHRDMLETSIVTDDADEDEDMEM